MVRVSVTYVGHRLLLFAVSLFVIYQSLPDRELKSFSNLCQRFVERVSRREPVRKLMAEAKRPSLLSWEKPPNPFLVLHRAFRFVSGLSPFASMLILSNVFFVFFLLEVNAVLCRFVPPGSAAKATSLAVLLPVSFELSLISDLTLSGFLFMAVIRRILDNRWLIAGMLYGLLALTEPLILALLPLILYIFVYFQRHFLVSVVIRRAVFFLVPFVFCLIWNRQAFLSLGSQLDNSAWYYLYESISGLDGNVRELLHSPLGTTIVVVLLAIGAVMALLYNTTIIHKMVPIYTFLYLLFTASYESLGIRTCFAALCLEGIALVSGRPATIAVQLLLVGLGMFEVAWAFRVA